ncbi:MAG: uroporphyrinogen-III C-methyltransferase [Chlorobium sp.]|nr:uroporphyrinogen-III C-methyltransferase [Chlorobium sp.]MCW8815716.1 uroporphyrinogen-III C-methyltransferase [Chlorobium sp.]MCW8819640.1 uroporphyrinogen-III C-methyltransferase [Ignavibacteriaceae bacterium]
MKRSGGYVYIIGAGPGDPELLTIKAERVLHEVDVILYDNLVSSELIEQFDALKIYTGKRKDRHHFEQDAINEEIVRHARQGKTVARLKGGDPFVFGRGGEEIAYMRKKGIEYEIIPGITAAHGASAYTEIPLTMRNISSSVAFCTGHPLEKIHVPDADTIVYYMVASAASDVSKALIDKGKPESTKVAIVQNATRYNQKIFTGTLGELKNRDLQVVSPALLILGENINEFIADSWYTKKKKVLIAGDDSGRYTARHHVIVRYPFILVKSIDNNEVRRCMEKIGAYSCILFRDPHAVSCFFDALMESGRDARDLANVSICATGKKVSAELLRHGLKPDYLFGAENIVEELRTARGDGFSGEDVLLPGSGSIDDPLVNALTALHSRVTPLQVHVQGLDSSGERIDLDCIDEMYFSSPSCVENVKSFYATIPENITVTTADSMTAMEYKKLFGG